MNYTHTEFLRLVISMRSAQREYFATRSKNALRHSLELERQVDHYAAQLEKQQRTEAKPMHGEGDGC